MDRVKSAGLVVFPLLSSSQPELFFLLGARLSVGVSLSLISIATHLFLKVQYNRHIPFFAAHFFAAPRRPVETVTVGLLKRFENPEKVSAHSKMVTEACPMSAAEVLKAIAQLAFHIAQPLRYFQTGVSFQASAFGFVFVDRNNLKKVQNRNTKGRENQTHAVQQCSVSAASAPESGLSCLAPSFVVVETVATTHSQSVCSSSPRPGTPKT